jgi:hypothetical protein
MYRRHIMLMSLSSLSVRDESSEVNASSKATLPSLTGWGYHFGFTEMDAR